MAGSRSDFIRMKSSARMQLNTALLGISFTVFTLVLTLRPELLQDEKLAFQMVLAIPLLISSMLARIRLSYADEERRWETFGFGAFILAYSFMVNTMGILLASIISLNAALVFFAVSVVSAIIYSAIEVSYDRRELVERVVKDGVFIAIVVVLGILPSLSI